MTKKEEEEYWTRRYLDQSTGWDIGYPSTPIKAYIDQLTNKDCKILIPGAGNAYEAEYLFKKGFQNVFVLDISKFPLENLKDRVPAFPDTHLLNEDFFKHQGEYDLILEQTFFCSFEPEPELRMGYAKKIHSLLMSKGKLVGLWFKHPIIQGVSKRPFGGSKEEYLSYLEPLFKVITFEDCYNSIPPRAGNELFGIFEKKKD